jgi:hypothetical protein
MTNQEIKNRLNRLKYQPVRVVRAMQYSLDLKKFAGQQGKLISYYEDNQPYGFFLAQFQPTGAILAAVSFPRALVWLDARDLEVISHDLH